MSSTLAANLAALREKRAQLRSEISELIKLGALTITKQFEVGKDRSGRSVYKTRTQQRGLTNAERESIGAKQREIADINETFRAFET